MKQPLLKYLIELDKKNLYLKELKGSYTPVELASQLKILEELEIIGIDWKHKKLHVNLNLETVFGKKTKIHTYQRTVPEYMKSDKTKINKPYIKK